MKGNVKKFYGFLKRNNVLIKTLSFVLTVVLVFYVIPSTIYTRAAELFEKTDGEIDSISGDVSDGTDYSAYTETVLGGRISEATELREETVKQFRLSDGNYVAAQYDYPVHFLDENGEWQDIDNYLYEDASEFSNKSSRIKFAKKITGNSTLFTLQDGSSKITLSLIGAEKGTVGAVLNSEDAKEDTALQKMLNLENLSSSVRYNEILDGVDLEYVVYSNNVKENIIVKERKEEYNYSFELKLNGYLPSLNQSGDVELRDENGEIKYTIPAPIVFDASGSVASTDKAAYTLTHKNGQKYILQVSVSIEWMNDSDRTFPVTIDPTIYTYDSAVVDTYIDSAASTSTGHQSTRLYVTGSRHSYWKSNNLPTIPLSAYIVQATFSVAAVGSILPQSYVGIYRVDTPWDNTLTWQSHSASNYGKLSTIVTDYKIINSAGKYSFDITEIASQWYDGKTGGASAVQYGIALATVSGHNASVQFVSSEVSQANAKPTLTITYKDMKGLEPYWQYSSHSIGGIGSGDVNLANGNLVFSIPTLTATDSLFAFTPTLVYNSALAGTKYYYNTTLRTAYKAGSIGRGFKINACESLVEMSVNDVGTEPYTYYVFCDADGTEHEFFQGEDGVFRDSDGLKLSLSITDTVIEMRDSTKTTKRFSRMDYDSSVMVESWWYLSELEDLNGNKLIFSTDSDYRPTAVSICPTGASSSTEMLNLIYNTEGMLCAVYNPSSKQSVILKYSASASSVDVVYSGCNYLRSIEYCYGSSETARSDVEAYAKSGTVSTCVIPYASSVYSYNASGFLTEVRDSDSGASIQYTWRKNHVAKVSEYADTLVGQEIEFVYGIGYSQAKTSGNDEAIGTDDDTVTRYIFDNYGRTVSIYSMSKDGKTIYGATRVDYEAQDNVKNNVSKQVVVGGSAVNHLVNGGFENGTECWDVSGAAVHTYGYTFEGEGKCCLSFSPTVSAPAYAKQYVSLKSGYYTLSMLIESEECADYSGSVKIFSTNDGAQIHYEPISLHEAVGVADQACFTTSFEIAQTAQYEDIYVLIEFTTTNENSDALIRIDRVMLNSNIGAADYSLVHYGSFDNKVRVNGVVNLPTSEWTGATLVNYTAPFNTVLKIAASDTDCIKQRVFEAPQSDLNAFDHSYNNESTNHDGHEYILSGFAKTVGIPVTSSAVIGISVSIAYYQGSGKADVVKNYFFGFNPDCAEWQFTCGHIPTIPGYSNTENYGCIRYIDVRCENLEPTLGYAVFDNISLIYATGDNVTKKYYNSSGNVSVIQNYGVDECYYYNGNDDVVTVINNRDELTEYVYLADRPGVISAVTEYVYTFKNGASMSSIGDAISDIDSIVTKTAKTKTFYTYDSYGLCTAVKIVKYDSDGNDTGEYMEETYHYNTAQGSKIFGAMDYSIDSLLNKTSYVYDTDNGQLKFIEYPDHTATVYTYDNAGRLTKVSPGYYIPPTNDLITYVKSDIDYVYGNDHLLTKIITDSTEYTISYNGYNTQSGISVGDLELTEYEYYPNNGKLKKVIFSNSFSEEYVYNALELLSEVWYNYSDGSRVLVCEYEYTAYGEVSKITDHLSGNTLVYRYDIDGRIIFSGCYNGGQYELYTEQYYDDFSRVSSAITQVGYLSDENYRVSLSYSYTYNTDGSLRLARIEDNASGEVNVNYSYDNLERITGTTVRYIPQGTSSTFTNEILYTYDNVDTRTTYYVEGYTSKINGATTSQYTYEYDAFGNIVKITNENSKEIRYYYDDLGYITLVQDEVANKEYVYCYDSAGNITSIETRAITDGSSGGGSDDDIPNEYVLLPPINPPSTSVTIELSYTNSEWGDLLTAYNGTGITYDDIGNPISYYNGSAYTFAWQGRALVGAVKGERVMSFAYDSDGLRASKTVDNATTHYIYDGTLLLSEYTDNATIVYIYNAAGSPIGFKYRSRTYAADVWDIYFYEKNLQGDIVAIYGSSGVKLISYAYTAWGALTISYHNNGDSTTAVNNNLTYRGYYYDSDLSMYYLQSRYYDPAICRFINADSIIPGVAGTVLGYNMFVYCFNNPITYTDISGNWPELSKFFKWLYSNAASSIHKVYSDISTDIANYDKNNNDPNKVLGCNYFSAYNGALVIITPFRASFSFGFIGLSHTQRDLNTLNHEFGHKLQLDERGWCEYITDIAIPSFTANMLWRMGKLPYDYYGSPWESEADKKGGVQRYSNAKPWPAGSYNSYWDLIKLFF